MINTEIARLNAEIDRLIEANQAPDGFSWEWHCNRKDEEIDRLRRVLGNVLDDLEDAGLIIQAERVREALGE